MQYPLKECVSTFLLLLLTAGCSSEQAKPPTEQPKPVAVQSSKQDVETPPAESKPVIEPEAINALERMSNYLRTLKTFSVSSQTSIDEELDSGQKIMIDGELKVTAQLPGRLHIDRKIVEKAIDQQFFYDGKTFTIYGNNDKYYASFNAPPTVGKLLDLAWNRYGIEMPLSDLFRWGTGDDDRANILSAIYIGTGVINGVSCDHFVYRTADLDWQLWIEADETPLPRKMVITTTQEKSSPQYISVMNWNLSPKISNKLFTFAPPKDAHKIEFAVSEEVEVDGN